MSKQELAAGLKLPPDTATRTLAVLGQKGSGKTTAAQRATEIMIARGDQVVVLDPTGVWWGLRSGADGDVRHGLDVIIMGGAHADVPLEPTAGDIVADFVISSGRSVVLDMSEFESNAEHVRFAEAFAVRLYRKQVKRRTPMHLMLDEADTFAPQRPQHNETRMLAAFEAVVRRGRSRGLGMTMITQRPACLNKNLLSQVDAVLCMRITGQQDGNVMYEWIGHHMPLKAGQSPTDFMRELPKLPQGGAFWWSPAWTSQSMKVQVHMKRTFDSASTPTSATNRRQPVLRAVDLDKLTEQIRASVEQVQSNSPAALKAEIVRLKAKVAVLEEAAKKVKPAELLTDKDRALLVEVRDVLGSQALQTLAGKLMPQATGAAQKVTFIPEVQITKAPKPAKVVTSAAGGGTLGKAERLILTALAQMGGSSKARLAAVTGYAINGGGFNNAISGLRARQLLVSNGDNFNLTAAGLAELGDAWDPLPTGVESIRYWMGKEGKAERSILQVLLTDWEGGGTGLTKHQVATLTGYAASGGGFNNALSRLRTLELITGRDTLALNEEVVQ